MYMVCVCKSMYTCVTRWGWGYRSRSDDAKFIWIRPLCLKTILTENSFPDLTSWTDKSVHLRRGFHVYSCV